MFNSDLYNILKVLEYLQKMKALKMTFFSSPEFWYWTKVKAKYGFTKYNASKRNTKLLCFFMFFRANISQVKLNKVLFLFNMTLH